jgi:hypothetical protein
LETYRTPILTFSLDRGCPGYQGTSFLQADVNKTSRTGKIILLFIDPPLSLYALVPSVLSRTSRALSVFS